MPPSHDRDSESSHGSWSPSRGPRPPPGPPSSGPSATGSIANSSPSRKSHGIGSTGVVEEADIYRNKDLSLVKIDSLPRDAAQFRGWKNSFVTRLCSIDKTGKDTVLHWVVPAFEVASVGDLSDPGVFTSLVCLLIHVT